MNRPLTQSFIDRDDDVIADAVARPVAVPKPVAVRVDHVSKHFSLKKQRLHVLDDISLEIRSGEFVAIVGASGCGKSTLLRLIAGLDTDFDGAIEHDGRPVHGPDLSRGLLFQDHRLFPWLTVLDNVALALLNSGLPRAEREQRAMAEIGKVGLGDFARAYPHQLSGGMSQRAAIARALVTRPRLLLLDEPLGALDALTRLKMQHELLRLWQEEGMTMVMVTHDIDEATFLADRIVVLDSNPGRIRDTRQIDLPHPRARSHPQFIATRDALLSHFQHPHTDHADG